LITRIIFAEEWRLWSSSICSLLHSCIASSLLGSYVRLMQLQVWASATSLSTLKHLQYYEKLSQSLWLLGFVTVDRNCQLHPCNFKKLHVTSKFLALFGRQHYCISYVISKIQL
jgi:hypothetical protein